MSFLLVYVAHPSKPEAARITGLLIHQRLIACANYLPVQSTYWWEGFPTTTDEIVTLYKTRPEHWDALVALIESEHKYQIPCIMKMWLMEANPNYTEWVYQQTELPHPSSAPQSSDGFDRLF